MRESRFTEEQMVTILREADRSSVAEAAKKHKLSEPTIYAWRKQFGQLDVADVKRLKALGLENGKLKKLLAERDLDIDIDIEVNVEWVIRSVRASASPMPCLRKRARRGSRLMREARRGMKVLTCTLPSGRATIGLVNDPRASPNH